MAQISLTGKTAIVTGSSQGLGKETATALHAAGAKVVINYFADPDGVNEGLATEVVGQLGDGAMMFAADVRNREELSAMADAAVAEFGSLDIVVNNAAVLRDRTIRKMSDEEWSAVIDTNLTGVFNMNKVAAEKLSDGGRIVSMSSVAGVLGVFGQVNYSSAKAGVIAMTKVLSKELARRNITVNAVAPGVVLTEMGQSIPEKARDAMLAQIPLGRFAEPSEIANTILFLCSDLASYITGQTIHVNGGWWAA